MFSPRTGTVAEKMDNQVDEKIKNERVNRLLKLSKAITKEKTKECLGNTYDVLVESIDEVAHAVNDSGRTILIEEKDGLEVNKFYTVKVVRVANNTLYAEIIK